MAIQITPKGNVLFSGPLTAHEETLLNARLNAGPKTIALKPGLSSYSLNMSGTWLRRLAWQYFIQIMRSLH